MKSALVQKHFSWLPSERRYRHCHQAFVSLAKYNNVSPQNGIQLCFCGGNLEFPSFLVFEKTSLHFVLSFVHQYSRLHCILLNEFDYEPKQVKSFTENAGPEASRVILFIQIKVLVFPSFNLKGTVQKNDMSAYAFFYMCDLMWKKPGTLHMQYLFPHGNPGVESNEKIRVIFLPFITNVFLKQAQLPMPPSLSSLICSEDIFSPPPKVSRPE